MNKQVVFFCSTVAILLTALVLDRLYFQLAYLPESAYFEPSIIVAVCSQFPLNLFLFANAGLLVWQREKISWHTIAPASFRLFVTVIAFAIAWAFSTYQYNFYVDQPHHADRLLLLLLPLLVYRHPAWLPIFIGLAISITFQFHHPFGRFSWTDKRILYHLLIVCHAFLLVQLAQSWRKRAAPHQSFSPLLYLILCLHAVSYLNPGLLKLQLNWLRYDDLSNLFAASYQNGWLATLSVEQVSTLAAWVRWLNPLLLLLTLVTELGAALVFVHRRASILIFAASTLLHVGIFLSSGIFFWKWIVLNIALIVLLRALQRQNAVQLQPLFSRTALLVSPLFLALSIWVWRPIQLGWYDTPIVHLYELEAVGVSGEQYTVPRHLLAPYDMLFAQNRFTYLSDDPLVVGTYGGTLDRTLYLETLREPLDYPALQAEFGRIRADPTQAATFDQFITRFFGTLNKRTDHSIFWNKIAPPHHIWNSGRGNIYGYQEPIAIIRVKFSTVYFDGKRFQTLDEKIIREIPILL